MRRPARRPRQDRGTVQYFTYGPLEFNVNRAWLLAGNRDKYRPQRGRPAPDWIGPNIDIDPGYVEASDLGKPVLLATIVMEGSPWPLLIDGNHRVAKALRHGAEVPAITLDLEDTLRVVSGPAALLAQMRHDGERLGLLPPRTTCPSAAEPGAGFTGRHR